MRLKKETEVRLVNIMPLQSPPNSKIPLTLRNNLKNAVKNGIIIVVPAGNFGPLIGTLNPLAKIENTISVGGASNDGKKLMSFSSRGIPKKTGDRPTIVAPSENIIGITHSGITPVLLKQKKLKHLLTSENYYLQWGYKPTPDEIKEYEHKYVIGTGTSQSCELVGHIIARIISLRQGNNLKTTPKIIRKILCDAALKMDGYGKHEVGCGFVNIFVLNDYLKRISNQDFPSQESGLLWGKSFSLNKFSVDGVQLIHSDNTRYDIMNYTDEKELINPLLETGKSPFDEDFGIEIEDEGLMKNDDDENSDFGI